MFSFNVVHIFKINQFLCLKTKLKHLTEYPFFKKTSIFLTFLLTREIDFINPFPMRRNIASLSLAENLIRDCSYYSYGLHLSKMWSIITFCLGESWSHKNLTNEALHFPSDLALFCSYGMKSQLCYVHLDNIKISFRHFSLKLRQL